MFINPHAVVAIAAVQQLEESALGGLPPVRGLNKTKQKLWSVGNEKGSLCWSGSFSALSHPVFGWEASGPY